LKRIVLPLTALVLLGGFGAIHHSADQPAVAVGSAHSADTGAPTPDDGLRELALQRASRSRTAPARTPAPRAAQPRAQRPSPVPVHRSSTTHHHRTAAGDSAQFGSASAWAHSPLAIRYANCESGDRGAADQSHYNGGYKGIHLHDQYAYTGKWQIGRSEWRGVGGAGAPWEASEAEQDYRAWLIWKARGWQPWAPSYSCAHR